MVSWNEKHGERRMKILMQLKIKLISNKKHCRLNNKLKRTQKQWDWKFFWHSIKKQQNWLSWCTYCATKHIKQF